NEQREIDRSDTSDHVFHEILVPGHINSADVKTHVWIVRRSKLEMGEAEIDCDFSRLFFRQPIRIGPGQRFDQCALTVVNMAGGGAAETFLGHMGSRELCTAVASVDAICSSCAGR